MKKKYWFDNMVDSLEERVEQLRILSTGTEIDPKMLQGILHELARDIEWGRWDMMNQVIEETKK